MADWPAYKAGSARITLKPRLSDDFKSRTRALLAPIKQDLKVQIRPELAAGFRTNLRNMVRQASSGVNASVGIRVNTSGVRSQVRAATRNMAPIRLHVDLDLRRAVTQLEAFRAQVAAQPLALNVNVDTTAAMAQLAALRTLAGTVGNQIDGIGRGGALVGGNRRRLSGGIFTRPARAIRMQIEIDRASVARAEAEVAQVAARLSRARNQATDALDRFTLAEQRHNEVMQRASATESQRLAATQALARARRQLADSNARVNSLMGDERDADRRLTSARDARSGLSGMQRIAAAGLSGLAGAIGDMGRNMLNFSNIVNVALAGLVALAAVSLIPLIGQLVQAAGVVGLFPAALAGAISVFAAVKIAVSGIGDAFDAAGKVAESAGQDMEARAKAVASAKKQEAAAAKQVEAAARGIGQAERGVRDAQKNTLQAQRDLNRARQSAKKDIDDLNRALGRTALTEESAAIAVAEAQRSLYQTFLDPNSDAIDRARAQNNVKQALADQQDIIRDNRDLAQQAAEANAKGVEGSDQVVAAKERVSDAIEKEGDAQQNLADAHARLADAQADLVEAQQAVTTAMTESSKATDKFNEAMSKLSPNAQDFVKKMLELKEAFKGFKSEIQNKFFDGLGTEIKDLGINWLPTLKTGLGDITTQINLGLRRAIADLDTDASRSKLETIFRNVAASIGPVIDGINDIFQGILSLAGVGSEFLPGLSGGFADFAEKFRQWAESPEGQQKFKDFLRESLDTFKEIWGVVKELGTLLKNIFTGSDETGESWLTGMKDTLKGWNDFLGSEEGQQKIKDFFADVKQTVSDILSIIEAARDIVDFFTPDEPEDPKNKNNGPEDILDPQGSDGAGLDGFNTTPPEDAVDPSRTENIPWYKGGGKKYYNYRGERVDKNGNRLDHTDHPILPGVREGSIFDRMLDINRSTQIPGARMPWQDKPSNALPDSDKWFAESDPDGTRALKGFQQKYLSTFKGIRESAETDIGAGVPLQFGLLERAVDATGARVSTTGKSRFTDSNDEVRASTEGALTDAGSRWSGFGDAMFGVVGRIVGEEIMGKFRGEFNSLPEFFGGIVGGIGFKWGELPGALQGPVNAVIGVLNTFGGLWNKVADKLGLPKWDPIDPVGAPPPPDAGGGQSFWEKQIPGRAKGGPGGPYKSGRVDGPGNRYDDKAGVYRLARGEHVWTADEVEAAGGHDVMYSWRKAVRRGGGKQSRGNGLANGGGIIRTSDPLDPVQAHLWDMVREAIPSAELTSGKRFVDVGSGFDLHMQGKAIDLGGPMKQIARWIYNTFPQSAELIHWPLDGWQNLDNGQPYNFGDAVNAQHTDHVHWGAENFLTELSEDQKKGLLSRIGSAIGGIVDRGRDVAADLLTNPLRAAAGAVPDFPHLGEAGRIPKAFANKMVDALAAMIAGRAGSGGGGANYVPSAGVEQWRDLAIRAMRHVGFNADDPAQVNAMMAQIQSESGGNPSIVQQVQDVNSGGNEAQGLLQVIPGTFATYRDPSLPNDRTDPYANMVAALRYYKDRYGMDLTEQWGHGHGYDQGGILKDKHWGFNVSGLPEAVLTNPQWKMFDQFVQSIPGFNNRLQALPQPLNGGTNPDGTPGTFGVPINPGVDTFEMVGAKAKDRFLGAAQTGFNDLLSSTLGPLGIPDPRTLIPSEVVEYGRTLDAWHKARAASAQASQALAQSGYQAAGAPAVGAASTVMQSNGQGGAQVTNIDNSTVINLQTPNVDEAYRKAQQIRDMRALQHTATARG
ncbi:transglycosylase SLT domain-containing protein [Nocardia cyriacigeorgica]|uniref:transglycosylase SLT domain-containing protein n=1 Tax=Nocardia cyriacigeorgica TaxID=135487 RepID=UPI001E5CA814|nr:transglycosylase SLT domain-containing protein [Nocardia cyriacigeorgica]